MGRYDWEDRGRGRKKSGWAFLVGMTGAAALGVFGWAYIAGNAENPEARKPEIASAIYPFQRGSAASASAVSETIEQETRPSEGHSPDQRADMAGFEKCGAQRYTCVVDGDTFWLKGEKIRIADIDTPEVSQPKCSDELALGLKATERLIALLNEGPFDLVNVDRDRDSFGRKLRVVERNGKSVGSQLVSEGLAHPWNGGKQPWC